MNEKIMKVSAIACAGLLVLSGCGKKTDSVVSGNLDFTGYPIKTEEKLTYWVKQNTALSTYIDNIGKSNFAQKLKEKTGVEIEYIHPAAGQEATSLSLLVASGQMPDMVEFQWTTYNNGGAAKSLKEKIILPLNELIEKNAPNLKKYLSENPDVDKMVKTAKGQYYVFPFIRGDKRLLVSTGTMIRKDWLDELGMDMPKSIDDLEIVLKAFKEKKGADKPLCFTPYSMDIFFGNFSAAGAFYLDGDRVAYGPLSSNYESAIRTMHKWYDEGLLDPNFVSVDNAALDTNVLSGKTGVTVASGGGNLGTWLDNKAKTGEKFDMQGMPFTSLKSGEKNTYYNIDSKYPGSCSVAITSSCKNPSLAARYLDYGYSEEGSILYNYGTEGESFEIKDGEYIYNDNIYNNPDGMTVSQAMGYYFKSSVGGPFVQQRGYIDQYYFRPQQQKTLDAWISEYDDVQPNVLPPIAMTEEESTEYASIMNEVKKYVSVSRTGFINGTVSLDKYDEFKQELKNLKIDRAIEIQQAAYDRYKNN